MNPTSRFLACILIGMLGFGYLFSQENSVVVIHTNTGKSGYGFSFSDPNLIVTALHIVSGASNDGGIQIVASGNRKTQARIIKVLRNQDLALLQLSSNLGLAPLAASTYRPGTRLQYWESPAGQSSMSSKSIVLGPRIPLDRLDARFRTQQGALDAFKSSLCTRPTAYPVLNTPVIKFADHNIGKAHSGSPITIGGRVVGMVDGGDKPTNGAKNTLWAIPATSFQQLIDRGAQPSNLVTCNSSNLYSGLRSDNPFLSQEAQQYAAYYEQTSIAGTNYSLAYIATCRDLYGTMSTESQQTIRDLFSGIEPSMPDPLSYYDLLDQRVMVFVDQYTGSVLAIPQNSSYSGKTEYGTQTVTISSAYESISMYVYSEQVEEYDFQQNLNDYVKYMTSDGDWQYESHEVHFDSRQYADYEDDAYYDETFDYNILDEYGEIDQTFSADITIDGEDFLGVALQINDFDGLLNDRDERLYMYLLQACIILTDFSYY